MPTDLISLQSLYDWANIAGTPNPPIPSIAQEIIDGLTQAVYWITGRNGSTLTEEDTFTDTYNGTGSGVLYLLNTPIVSVASVLANGVNIPASLQFGQAGYFIQQDGKSIAMRSPGGANGYPYPYPWGRGLNYGFPRGRGNVVVTYNAGYSECPPDVYLAVVKQAAIFLAKRLREDEASHMIPQSGQTNYRDWALQPEVRLLLEPYRRGAMANIFV